jgi:hypothetical protein
MALPLEALTPRAESRWKKNDRFFQESVMVHVSSATDYQYVFLTVDKMSFRTVRVGYRPVAQARPKLPKPRLRLHYIPIKYIHVMQHNT